MVARPVSGREASNSACYPVRLCCVQVVYLRISPVDAAKVQGPAIDATPAPNVVRLVYLRKVLEHLLEALACAIGRCRLPPHAGKPSLVGGNKIPVSKKQNKAVNTAVETPAHSVEKPCLGKEVHRRVDMNGDKCKMCAK